MLIMIDYFMELIQQAKKHETGITLNLGLFYMESGYRGSYVNSKNE